MPKLTIHATPVDANLIVWAETEQKRKHNPGPADMIPFHPWAATQQLLESTLKPIIDGFQKPITRAQANAWLPTYQKTPIHSTPARRPGNLPDQLTTSPWAVSAIKVDQADVIRFIHLLVRPQTNTPNLIPGVDVIYWDTVNRFILSLMTRQSYLPDFDRESERFLAKWTPAYWPNDRHILHQLTALMPPAANATQTHPTATRSRHKLPN